MKKKECNCRACIKCCWHNPGWFGSVEEIEGAAKIRKMPLKDFAKEYLIQEWWDGSDDFFIPAPRRNFKRSVGGAFVPSTEDKKNGKGFVRATWGHNLIWGVACIFLTKDDKCSIHKSKPQECRESFGCRGGKFGRERLLCYWKKHQKFIELLQT